MSGILSIENDEADLGKITNQFINDKSDFNNKHIIKDVFQTKIYCSLSFSGMSRTLFLDRRTRTNSL